MAASYRIKDRTGSGVGVAGTWVPRYGTMVVTLEDIQKDMANVQAQATAGYIEIAIGSGTNWLNVTKQFATTLAFDPSDAVSMRQITYIDLQADATAIHALDASGHAAATVLAAAFSGNQMNHPRSVKIVVAGTASTFPLTFTVVGYDVRGRTMTETFTFAAAATVQGKIPFAYIVSFTHPIIAAVDTVSFQLASKIGLPFPMASANGLGGVYINGAYEPAGDFTIDSDYNTILETGQTISASDDYTIYARPHFLDGAESQSSSVSG